MRIHQHRSHRGGCIRIRQWRLGERRPEHVDRLAEQCRRPELDRAWRGVLGGDRRCDGPGLRLVCKCGQRSEEHTSELQSLMRISYAVFCLKKKTTKTTSKNIYTTNNN